MYFVEYVNGQQNVVTKFLRVTLTNHNLKYYPYLDTFKFYNPHTGVFANTDSYRYEYVLVQSNGGLLPPEPEPESEYNGEEEFDDQPWAEI